MVDTIHVDGGTRNRRMMLCHGAFDTLKDNPSEQYKTITMPEVAAMVENPQSVDKKVAAFIIPSEYNQYDGRSHEVQRQMGRFHALTIDIDEGSPTIDQVSAAVESIIGHSAYMIYSSASSSHENMKWRVIIPVGTAIYGTDFSSAQMSIYQMLSDGDGIVCDASLSRPGQPVYLPNVSPDRRDSDGEPFFYQYKLHRGPMFEYYDSEVHDAAERARIADEEAAIEAREQAERRAAQRAAERKSFDDDVDPIVEFNRAHSISDMLMRYGYERQGRSNQYRSPYQTSGSYATKDFGDHWVSLSGSDASAGIGAKKAMGNLDYCFGDAFDLYAHFEHGGDMTKAIREYAAELRGPDFERPVDPLDDFDIVQAQPVDALEGFDIVSELSDDSDRNSEKMSEGADEEVQHVEDDEDPFANIGVEIDDIPNPVSDAPEASIWPTPLSMFDSSLLPRRRWVYGYDYIRGYVSVLASAGGIGKTSLTVVEAISVATDRALLGTPVKERTNVWVINLEDPRSEIEMRTLAAMQHYGIHPDEVEGRLFVDGEDTFSVTLAAESRDGIQQNDEMLNMMIRKIKENDIGLVIIDPFVSTHTVNENSNSGVQAVVAMLRRMARETQASVVLVHHVRKGGGEDATIDSVRGAGALIGAARAARVVNKISPDDAVNLGFSEADSKGIFRVDDGKSNLAPPADAAVYRRMIGVQIDNGEWVGVAVPVELPNAFDGISAKDARKVQDIVGGAEDKGEAYAANSRNRRWVGYAVADVLNINADDAQGKARISKIVKTWLSTDVLRVTDIFSKRDGREVPSVTVGEWITPEEVSG